MPEQHQAVIAGSTATATSTLPSRSIPSAESWAQKRSRRRVAGYRLTHTWLASFGPIAAVGVESTAPLERL